MTQQGFLVASRTFVVCTHRRFVAAEPFYDHCVLERASNHGVAQARETLMVWVVMRSMRMRQRRRKRRRRRRERRMGEVVGEEEDEEDIYEDDCRTNGTWR